MHSSIVQLIASFGPEHSLDWLCWKCIQKPANIIYARGRALRRVQRR
jgi:hypothetical protein